MTPPTDIVVTVHNALEQAARCIADVYKNTENFRLIVVDDDSGPVTRAWLQGLECLQRSRSNLLLQTNYPRYWVRASNLGLRLARTPWVALLNADVTLGPGWLEELYEAKGQANGRNGARVGLVGHICSNMCWGLHYREGEWEFVDEPNYVNGHCWLLNMEAMRQIAYARTCRGRGGHIGSLMDETDPDLIHYRADPHTCWELAAQGYKSIAVFRDTVQHAMLMGDGTARKDLRHPDEVSLGEVDDDWQGARLEGWRDLPARANRVTGGCS